MFGSVEYWFSVIKITAIVAFILIGSYVVFVNPSLVAGADASAGPGAGGSIAGFHHYFDHGGFFPKGIWGMWVAVIVSIFSYLSIEMIAVAAGEAERPRARRHARVPLDDRASGAVLSGHDGTDARDRAVDRGRSRREPVREDDDRSAYARRGGRDQFRRAGGGAIGNEQPALHHHAHDVQPRARRLRAAQPRRSQRAWRAVQRAAAVDGGHRYRDRGQRAVSRRIVHDHDGHCGCSRG